MINFSKSFYSSKSIYIYIYMAIASNIFIFGTTSNLTAQDCGTCSNTWTSGESTTFNYGSCIFYFDYEYRECEDSTDIYREFRIGGIQNLTSACDTVSPQQIYEYSIKLLLSNYYQMFDVNYYDTNKVTLLSKPCIAPADMSGYINLCGEDTNCHKVDYNLTGFQQFTEVIGSKTFTKNYMPGMACGAIGPCGVELPEAFYTIPPGQIYYQIYSDPLANEDCDEICFWKLEGNEEVNDVFHFLGTINNSDLNFKTNNTQRMQISNDGNVGIGTINPLGKLDINFATWGGADPIFGKKSYPRIVHQSNSNIPSINFATATGGTECGENNDREIYHWQIEGETGNFNPNDPTKVFYGALNFNAKEYCLDIIDGLQNDVLETKVTFTREGHVGIMTNTPMDNLHIIGNMRINAEGDDNALESSALTGTHSDYLLAVEGKIVAQEIIVTETNWADYVFKPNYNLLPLSELELRIKQLGHLPGMPSELEVKENGYSVNEMQVKMLEKIEELTLYMIELKKENEKLQSEINKLKGE